MLDRLEFWKSRLPASVAWRQYHKLARAWDKAGRPDALLLDGLPLTIFGAWTITRGAKHDGVTPLMRAYKARCWDAADAADPDWYDRDLSVRYHCSGCGERYMLENLALCTSPTHDVYYCPDCTPSRKAPNGNPQCYCGGEVVG